ncbi:hypothetical protein Bbelb_064590 [Branchiostoma belcheri]|nr:hypothetical protein Bbelb_064590 [Branchiostoma belcheri]
MPPDPPSLLAPLALDSRFCARLRAPSALHSQNPSVKLAPWADGKKVKLGRALADVDSDSPLFVDAYLGTRADIEEHVQIGLVASAVPGTAVTSPRTGNGCLRAGDADVGCFGGLGCVRRWLDVDGLLPNAREEEKVPGEVHPGPDGWMADVSGPSVVSFPDQERKRSHGARWPSCAPFLAEGRCMYTEKEEDMCPLNSFNLTTNCNHWRRRH